MLDTLLILIQSIQKYYKMSGVIPTLTDEGTEARKLVK